MLPKRQPSQSLRDYLLDNVTEELNVAPLDVCWVWRRSVTKKGYSQVSIGRRMKIGHRVAYEEFVGPIPGGLQLDHLCRVKRCIRPKHLEPVTRAENWRRHVNSITQCPQGHWYSPANTYAYAKANGATHRVCKECSIERVRRGRAAQNPG